MNLTEPQAGSDLAQVRTRAVPQPDGSYRICGQKIFITFGEHDLADNIVHLVLARTPDAPEGVKGISLFLVPKFLVNADGSLGKRNDVFCASIEHKLGIKASPTAVLIYGDDKGEVGPGAIGHLIGEENRGLEYMFIMMNAARFQVGMQGIAIAERAYQKAVAFARERVQSRAVEGSSGPVPIIGHPDVRRMLMIMRANTEARACAGLRRRRLVRHRPRPSGRRTAHSARRPSYEYLVPIVKGWAHRNVRSTWPRPACRCMAAWASSRRPAPRSTTAMRASSPSTRARPPSRPTTSSAARPRATAARWPRCSSRRCGSHNRNCSASVSDDCSRYRRSDLKLASTRYDAVVEYVVAQYKSDIRAVFAGSVPYLKLAGIVHCGWQMGRAALAAQRGIAAGHADAAFLRAKLATARFYADHILSSASGLAVSVTGGARGVLALSAEEF